MPVHIRAADPTDIPGVRDIARRTWAFAYRDLIPPGVQSDLVSRWYADEALRGRMERGVLLVAESGTPPALVGFVNLFRNNRVPGEVAVAAIYVLPEHERRGIGTALLREALAGMPEARRLVASVERGNAGGLAFYNSRGFEVVGETMDEVAEGVTLPTVEVARSLPWD